MESENTEQVETKTPENNSIASNNNAPVMQQQANDVKTETNKNDDSKYQGEIDALRSQLEEQRKRYEKLQKNMDTIQEEQEKNNILTRIQKAHFNLSEEDKILSSDDIMKKIIKENSTINIDGKSRGYIEGVFETICNQGQKDFDDKPAKSGLEKTIPAVKEQKPVAMEFNAINFSRGKVKED